MNAKFRVFTTPAFERSLKRLVKKQANVRLMFEAQLMILEGRFDEQVVSASYQKGWKVSRKATANGEYVRVSIGSRMMCPTIVLPFIPSIIGARRIDRIGPAGRTITAQADWKSAAG